MGKCQQCDSHVKGRLRDGRGEGEKAGQERLRFTGPIAAHHGRQALGHVLWLCRQPAYVEQCRAVLRCAEHPDPGRTGRQRTAVRRSGDHLGALDVSTGVWGGDQPPGGARGPQLPTRSPPSGCCAATGSLSPRWRTFGVRAGTPASLEVRRHSPLIRPQHCPNNRVHLTLRRWYNKQVNDRLHYRFLLRKPQRCHSRHSKAYPNIAPIWAVVAGGERVLPARVKGVILWMVW